MGTATNQIATRLNVNSKRLGAFVTGTSVGATYMKKCVTKSQVDDIQYLSATGSQSASTLSGSLTVGNRGSTKWNSCWSVATNGTTTSAASSTGTPVVSGMYAYVTGYNSSTYYQSSTSYLMHCLYSGESYTTSVSTIKNAALCYKNISVTAGKYTTVSLNVLPYCNASTSSTLSTSYNVSPNSATNVWYAVIVDANDNLLYTSSVKTSYTASYSLSISFTPSTSTVTLYFVPTSIDMKFYPATTGNLYVRAGFYLSGSVVTRTTHYDSTAKVVRYADIYGKTGTFNCSYYIYNNKSSSAKLDWVRCYVGATSDPTKGTWTQVGSVTQGTVSGGAAGTVTCTIPASYMSSTQYWFYVRCGSTAVNQEWYGGWGTGGANSNASTYCGKDTQGYTPAVPLTSPTYTNTVLNYNLIRSAEGPSMGYIVNGIYGQTTTKHALFRIE